MNFDLSPAEQGFRDELRAWLAVNAPSDGPAGPLWSDAEMARRRRWQRRLFEAGYAGIAWPREYGGRGSTQMEQVIFNEEIVRRQVPELLNTIGIYMIGPTIISAGTDEQKRRYLTGILSGDEIWCQGFSEPNAGSDLASIQCRAIDCGDHFEVTGQKVWTTLARVADWCLLLARTGTHSGRRADFTMFIVSMKEPGVTVRPLRDMTGGSQFNEIFFDNVAVPKSQVVGGVGSGWKVAMVTLSHERGTLALDLAARIEMAFESVLEVARERAHDWDLSHRERARQQLAQLYIECRTLRLNGYRALHRVSAGGAPGPEGAMGRLHWSQINQRLHDLGVELLGMEGAVDLDGAGSRQEDWLRARASTIAGGTAEILRNALAERVLGLPRSR